jgi:hypothetical protein
MIAGQEIGVRIDQALLQDATGTLVQLELEAIPKKSQNRSRGSICGSQSAANRF